MTDSEEFEKAIGTKGYDTTLIGNSATGHIEYADAKVDVAWSAWQARGERIKELEAKLDKAREALSVSLKLMIQQK